MSEQHLGKRKTQTGRVVSDKADKTIVISVERLAQHPTYKRVIRRTARFMAHDELNDAKIGDLVTIEESRPLSARGFFISVGGAPDDFRYFRPTLQTRRGSSCRW